MIHIDQRVTLLQTTGAAVGVSCEPVVGNAVGVMALFRLGEAVGVLSLSWYGVLPVGVGGAVDAFFGGLGVSPTMKTNYVIIIM